MTPLLAMDLAIPPWFRTKTGMIRCLGMMPKNTKNGTLYIEYIVKAMAKLAPGTTQGMPVVLPSRNGEPQELRHKYAVFVATINDMRATQKGSRKNEAGSLNLFCNTCFVKGISIENRVVYPGFGRCLPLDHPLRPTYESRMERIGVLPSAFYKGPPHKAVPEEFRRAGMAAGDSDTRVSPIFPVFSSIFQYFFSVFSSIISVFFSIFQYCFSIFQYFPVFCIYPIPTHIHHICLADISPLFETTRI